MNLKNIKRWHLSLGAVIIQALFATYWLVSAIGSPPVDPNDDFTSLNAIPVLFGIFSAIIMGLLLIPTILLKINNDKTKKVGSVLSMIFGIIAASYLLLMFINYLRFPSPLYSYMIIYLIQIIQAAFLLMAGRQSVM